MGIIGQPIELLADVRGFGRRVGERDGAVECNARLPGAAKLQQECAARAVEVEVAVELRGERFDHGECLSGAAHLGDARATDRDDLAIRDGLTGLSADPRRQKCSRRAQTSSSRLAPIMCDHRSGIPGNGLSTNKVVNSYFGASISGHKTRTEIERYTAAADQRHLSRAAKDKLRTDDMDDGV